MCRWEEGRQRSPWPLLGDREGLLVGGRRRSCPGSRAPGNPGWHSSLLRYRMERKEREEVEVKVKVKKRERERKEDSSGMVEIEKSGVVGTEAGLCGKT